MDKNIPLSELIRIGSKVTKQCSHRFSYKSSTGELHTCALGAAYYAKFGEVPNTTRTAAVLWALGVDPFAKVREPIHGNLSDLGVTITALNDYRNWPRPKIASWLESIGR